MTILLALAGCAPSGIYMLTIPYVEGSIECDETLDENFTDAFSPDVGDSTDSDWTETTNYVGATTIAFIHISPTSGGAVLTWGDAAFPGKADQGGWTFTWSTDTEDDTEIAYKSDYRNASYDHEVSTTTIHVEKPLFAEMVGTVSSSSTSTIEFDETDEWDEADIGYNTGLIPSDAYLVYKDSGDLIPQTNLGDEDECKGDECYIVIETSCSQASTEFTAQHVSGNDVQEYDTWKEDAQ